MTNKEVNNKKRNLLIVGILLLLLLCVSLGSAYLSQMLQINGTTNIGKSSWSIYFDNEEEQSGSVEATNPLTIDTNKTLITFGVTFTKPGEFYEFEVDTVNDGAMDAMVNRVTKAGISEENAKYISFEATYSDGAPIQKYDLLAKQSRERIKVRVEFKEVDNKEDLPPSDLELNLELQIEYIQSDENAHEREISFDNLPMLRYGVLSLDYQKSSLVKKIYLDTSINIPEGISAQDVSDKQDGRVVAYFVPNKEDSTKYDLHIEGNGGLYANPVSWNLFSTFPNTEEIIGAEKLNTSFMTNMQSMFCLMKKLKSVDVSTWDLSNVTDMSHAFGSTYALTSLDTSNWNLNKVTDMQWAFGYAHALGNLDATNWGLSNVVNMEGTFFETDSLKTLNTSNWDLNKVTTMWQTFEHSAIESIDGSNWGLSSLETMEYAFGWCNNLKLINASNWNLSNLKNASKVFYENSSLTTIEGSETWGVSSITDMSYMFFKCYSLQTLNFSNLDVSNVTSMYHTFFHCQSLETLDITNWDTSNVQDFGQMFFEAFKLKNIDVSKFNFASAKKVDSMFEYCNSLSGTINLNAKILESGKNFFAFTYNQQEKRYGIEPLVINYVAETEELVDEVVNRYQYPYCRIGISEYPGYAYFDCGIQKGTLIEE